MSSSFARSCLADDAWIELSHEIPCCGWGTRAEAQGVQTVHHDDALGCSGRCRLNAFEGKELKQSVSILVAGTPHGNDDLRCQRDDCLIQQWFEADGLSRHVCGAGEREDGIRAGVPAADHCTTVLHGQNEKGLHRLRLKFWPASRPAP